MAVSLPAMPLSAPSEVDFVHGATVNENSHSSFYKFSFQRLKLTTKKFQKMLEADFERLEMHRNNIDKLTAIEDWVGLHKEQVNATRTVQQVKATLRELEQVRTRVLDDEVNQFDKQVRDTKVKAVCALQSFLRIRHAGDPQIEIDDDHTDSGEGTSLPGTVTPLVTVPQTHVELRVVPENSQAAVSGEDLLMDTTELYELVLHFARIVEEHAEAANISEDGTSSGHVEVGGTIDRERKTPSLGYALLPVVGAVVGGVFAGPVGVVAGLKLSGFAGAMGGSVAAFAGGSFLRSQSKKTDAQEMRTFNQK
ncbi:syntaxin-17-like [Littorina saxatilis]|uniref:STX17-like N-terminal domain-containing protein n=1 Tax=Littorina saxatilis TaxID=31220 RepID=A0AAN9B1U9_9CAEN